MAKPVRIMIVDDHAVVRIGLKRILETEPGISIVAEASNGLEAINKAVELKPDIILMDIFMPRCSGLDAMLRIKERLTDARIIILTVSEQEEHLVKALMSGAMGYLVKGSSEAEVLEAVRRAAAGEIMLSPDMITKLVSEFRAKAAGSRLSRREAEVLQLLGEGLTNSGIARRLFVDVSTVKTYVSRIMTKLHLRNRAEVILFSRTHPDNS